MRGAADAVAFVGAKYAADRAKVLAYLKPAEKPAASCFLSRNWSGWRSPDENTIYLRENLKDIYRVDLSGGSSLLTWPDSHLVNVERGTDEICAPIDLQLTVAQDGVREPLFVKAITKLSPEQIAAIPKKFLP